MKNIPVKGVAKRKQLTEDRCVEMEVAAVQPLPQSQLARGHLESKNYAYKYLISFEGCERTKTKCIILDNPTKILITSMQLEEVLYWLVTQNEGYSEYKLKLLH